MGVLELLNTMGIMTIFRLLQLYIHTSVCNRRNGSRMMPHDKLSWSYTYTSLATHHQFGTWSNDSSLTTRSVICQPSAVSGCSSTRPWTLKYMWQICNWPTTQSAKSHIHLYIISRLLQLAPFSNAPAIPFSHYSVTKTAPPTTLLTELHWLSVKQRIIFIATLSSSRL